MPRFLGTPYHTHVLELIRREVPAARRWTKEARKAEREALQDRTWGMWLDCATQTEIGDAIGIEQRTVSNWLEEIRKRGNFLEPPASRQHFDIWQFQTAARALAARLC